MKNLKIRTKLFLLTVLLLIFTVLMSVISMICMNSLNNSSIYISETCLPAVILAEEIDTLTTDFRLNTYGHVVASDKATKESFQNRLNELSQKIQEKFSSYQQYIVSEEDRRLFENAHTAWHNYTQYHDHIIELSNANKVAEAGSYMLGQPKVDYDAASDAVEALVEFNRQDAENASSSGDRLYNSASRYLTLALVLCIIIGSGFAIVLVRSILKPISEIDHVAKEIANGNLNESIHYQSKDALGTLAKNFNKTVVRLQDYVKYIEEISNVLNEIANGNLLFRLTYDYAGEFAKIKDALINISNTMNDTLGRINQSSDQVASGADQVSSGAQALSQGATEQASSVQELAATINDISAQITKNASNAHEANQQAKDVEDEARESNRRMQEMVTAMADISESSSQIGKIIKTIEDIAFQTNILALNAAVEAARAGAAGKGFAVVADEVRNLASKSAEASKNTSALIEASLAAVEKGTMIAGNTATSLEKVTEGIQKVAATVDQISAASTIQAESVVQVTTGIDQISSVVQTNSATAEESAAASEELSSQAQVLKTLISRFRLRKLDSASSSLPQASSHTTSSISSPAPLPEDSYHEEHPLLDMPSADMY